ncbi:MAG: class I SAM-dependent methyltransferase [Usitatibacter sp.]
MNDDLPFTGERFIPGAKGEIWVEHWHRYHFAARWCEGRRVLDVACGEGYGSALLARNAQHVTGVDISAEAVAHAQAAYAGLANARFVAAPCTAIPLPDASVDVAVSFETIEHIGEQEEFLAELARVLTPEGVLVLSCPNKLEYSDKRGYANEFHVKELYRDELEAIVAARFPHLSWYGQRPSFFSVIAPETPPAASEAAQLVEVSEGEASEVTLSLSHPLYFLVVASRSASAVAATPPALSVLSDRDDWVHKDYEKVMGELEKYAAHTRSLDAGLEEHRRVISELREDLRVAHAVRCETEAKLVLREAALHAREAELAMKHLAVSERERELAHRRSWRWWLKLPLIRLGLLK